MAFLAHNGPGFYQTLCETKHCVVYRSDIRPWRKRIEYTPMGEEHAAPEQDVRPVTGEPLKSLQQRLVYSPGTKLLYELVVVDGELFAVFGNTALDIPGCDDLLVRFSLAIWLERRCRCRAGCFLTRLCRFWGRHRVWRRRTAICVSAGRRQRLTRAYSIREALAKLSATPATVAGAVGCVLSSSGVASDCCMAGGGGSTVRVTFPLFARLWEAPYTLTI